MHTHLNPVLGGQRLRLGGVNRGDTDHALERARRLFPVRLEVLAVACRRATGEEGGGGRGLERRSKKESHFRALAFSSDIQSSCGLLALRGTD